jgi:hypothetical protein
MYALMVLLWNAPARTPGRCLIQLDPVIYGAAHPEGMQDREKPLQVSPIPHLVRVDPPMHRTEAFVGFCGRQRTIHRVDPVDANGCKQCSLPSVRRCRHEAPVIQGSPG